MSVAALLALALCACGASSKEVAMAKTARYQGDKLAIFSATKAVVEGKYEITRSDENTLGMQTKPKWFSPEGLTQNPRGEGAEMIDLVDKSINLAYVVTMHPDGEYWVVKVTPVIARYNRGIPKPEPLKEGDISLPGWVHSKTDQLAIDIHKALAQYEVKSVPQSVPAGNESLPPAEPAPAADPAAAPAEGSAAAPATP